jgi:hypothetical protein
MTWGHWHPALWLIINMLAVYRITRLAVKDAILAKPRRWLVDRYEGGLVTLATCPWCLSVWIAAIVVLLTWGIPDIWAYPAFGLALAASAGWLSDREM